MTKTTICMLLGVLAFTGCGTEDNRPSSLYPEKPTLQVTSLQVENGGSQVRWNLSIDNRHKSTTVEILPWNDTTYFFSSLFQDEYTDRIQLECNTDIEGAGYVSCNDITAVVCDRVLIGSDYSDYHCDYLVKDDALVLQFKKKVRLSTITNSGNYEPTLVTVGTRYYYEAVQGSNVHEESALVYEKDENKMFNVYDNKAGR